MSKLNKYYYDLPSWSKGVLIVGGIGIIGFIAYKLSVKIKEKKELKDAMLVSNQADKEIKELIKKGIMPSYSNSQYEVFALKLIEAMDGCGTNENIIYEVFSKMSKRIDVLKLISAFGVRYYRPCAATQPISYLKYLTNSQSFGGNLATLLQYDLNDTEIEQINSILKSKKIDYSF